MSRHVGGERPLAGGIYSVAGGRDEFGVIKVLSVDEHLVHVRVYRGKWSSRPARVNAADLQLGAIHEANPGIDHLPVSHRVFGAWSPQLIAVGEVTEAELDCCHSG